MSEPGFASLGPSLLARKGGAKPAMRPQVAPLVADETAIATLGEDQLEDLGWNDMGDSEGHGAGADIVPINADVSADDFVSGPGPIVRRQQRRLEERVLADAVMSVLAAWRIFCFLGYSGSDQRLNFRLTIPRLPQHLFCVRAVGGRRLGLRPDDLWNTGLIALLAGFIVARVWNVFQFWYVYSAEPLLLFSLRPSGFAFWPAAW